MALEPGSRVGVFEVLSPLGRGGMGEVYRARDTELGRQVAIKVLPERSREDAASMARFRREARALAALNHPAIAAIYGFETSDSGRAIVLELVEGPTLRERLAAGPMAIHEVIDVARQIAEGLSAAHAGGLVHRDLKPANVKLAPDRVKILDFGLAKRTAPDPESDAETQTETALGLVVGTVPYMSPEQALGREVDARSDIFSLGVMLHEMTTGSRPFEGASATEIVDRILHLEPPPLRRPDGSAPAALESVIRRCLAKDRDRRYPDATALLKALRELPPDGGEGAAVDVPPTGALPVTAGAPPAQEAGGAPRRLWELDGVLGILLAPVLVYLAWSARKMAVPDWSWAAFYAVVLASAAGALARLSLLAMSAFRLPLLPRAARESGGPLRLVDGLAALSLLSLAAAIDASSYVVTFSLLGGLGLAGLGHALWIHSLLLGAAFPVGEGRAGAVRQP